MAVRIRIQSVITLAFKPSTLSTLCIPALFKSSKSTRKGGRLSNLSNWLNQKGHISHTTILYLMAICFIYLPMGLILRNVVFKENPQMNVSLYTLYSLGGCFGGLISYWVLIIIYYQVLISKSGVLQYYYFDYYYLLHMIIYKIE